MTASKSCAPIQSQRAGVSNRCIGTFILPRILGLPAHYSIRLDNWHKLEVNVIRSMNMVPDAVARKRDCIERRYQA